MNPKLLTPAQVSEWLGLKPATLTTMRSRPGKDPIPFVKVGGLVRYRSDQVMRWIERNTFDDAGDAKEYRKIG